MSRSKKKPYTKAKAISPGCRCHGGCEYCLSNRMYKNRKRKEKSEDELKYWKNTASEEN